jgi:hypothetical protein
LNKAILDTDIFSESTSHLQRIQQIGYPLTLANWR